MLKHLIGIKLIKVSFITSYCVYGRLLFNRDERSSQIGKIKENDYCASNGPVNNSIESFKTI